MGVENKSLWGFPIVESEEMPKGEIIFGRLPTADEIREHGSYEAAVQAQKDQFVKLRLDDEILGASEIE